MKLSIYIVLFIMYVSNYLEDIQLFPIGTLGFTTSDAAVGVFYLLVLKDLIWDGGKVLLANRTSIIIYALLVFTIFLSFSMPLVSGDEGMIIQYIKSFSHWFYTSLFVVLLFVFPIEAKVFNLAFKTILIASIFINAFGIYQIVARAYDLPLAWIKLNNASLTVRGLYFEKATDFDQISLQFQGFYRATSYFSEPSRLAQFNLIIFILLVIPFVQKRRMFVKSKLLNIIIFIFFISGAFLTFSLTFVLGAASIVLCIFLFEKIKPFKHFFIAVVGSIFVILIADYAVKSYAGISVLELFGQRIEGVLAGDTYKSKHTVGESSATRADNLIEAYHIFGDYPITGVGIGQRMYYSESEVFTNTAFMQVMAELGILGTFVYIGLFAYLFIESLRFLRKQDIKELSDDENRLNGLMLYFVTYLIVINFVAGNNWVSCDGWLFIGFVFYMVHSYELKIHGQKYTIRLVKTPLKDRFNRNIQSYLANKNSLTR